MKSSPAVSKQCHHKYALWKCTHFNTASGQMAYRRETVIVWLPKEGGELVMEHLVGRHECAWVVFWHTDTGLQYVTTNMQLCIRVKVTLIRPDVRLNKSFLHYAKITAQKQMFSTRIEIWTRDGNNICTNLIFLTSSESKRIHNLISVKFLQWRMPCSFNWRALYLVREAQELRLCACQCWYAYRCTIGTKWWILHWQPVTTP